MSGDQGHPARKLDPEELKQYLAESKKDAPAVTRRIVAQDFSEVSPKTVSSNLQNLANSEEICRLNDGDVVLYWYPREQDEAGEIPANEIVDDSINYEQVEPTDVPRELAERIADEKLPYYRPRSFWSEIAGLSQLGIMTSLGLVILGFGGIVAGSLGLQQGTARLILQLGFYLALISVLTYSGSTLLETLAARGYVTKDPLPERIKSIL